MKIRYISASVLEARLPVIEVSGFVPVGTCAVAGRSPASPTSLHVSANATLPHARIVATAIDTKNVLRILPPTDPDDQDF
jgi:hypothetical protein